MDNMIPPDWEGMAVWGCTLLFSFYAIFCFLVGCVIGHLLIYRVRG